MAQRVKAGDLGAAGFGQQGELRPIHCQHLPLRFGLLIRASSRSAPITKASSASIDTDRKLPKVIAPTDPCSAWTAKANKRVQFGYGLNYMIDVEHAVTVDVEATPARTYNEVAATRTMIDRTEKAFGVKPERLPADTAFTPGHAIGKLDAGADFADCRFPTRC